MTAMEELRDLIKTSTDKMLFEMWETSKQDMTMTGIATNAIIEAELEHRNLIALNEETMEYEILL